MTLTCIFILMSLLCFTSAQGHTGGVRSSLTYCDSKDSSSWLLATGQCTRCSGCAGAALQPGVPSAALAEQSRGGTTALWLQPQVTSSDPGCRQERFLSLFPPPPRFSISERFNMQSQRSYKQKLGILPTFSHLQQTIPVLR